VEARRRRAEGGAGALLAHLLGTDLGRRADAEAIQITGRTSGNKVIEGAMQQVLESVKRGGSISAPMREAPEAFPTMVVQMIAVGEETGALDTMFSKIADFYDDEVAASLKALTSILEPLMIIGVGAIVGFIVISMYLPLFSVYDEIK